MPKRMRIISLAVVISVGLPGCWTYTTSTNRVVSGNVAYVYFRRAATNDVVDKLHFGVNHGNPRTTLSLMLGFARSNLFKTRLGKVGFYLSDFDYFFDPDNDADFADAASATHNTSRCLVMHRNLNPFGDRHNWTYRDASDQYCDIGKGFV